MPWKIKVWVPVEEEKPLLYGSMVEVIEEMHRLQKQQPENRYTYAFCDNAGKEISDK